MNEQKLVIYREHAGKDWTAQNAPAEEATLFHNGLVEFVHLESVKRTALLLIHDGAGVGDVCIVREVLVCCQGGHGNQDGYQNGCSFFVPEFRNLKNKVSGSHGEHRPAGLCKEEV